MRRRGSWASFPQGGPQKGSPVGERLGNNDVVTSRATIYSRSSCFLRFFLSLFFSFLFLFFCFLFFFKSKEREKSVEWGEQSSFGNENDERDKRVGERLVERGRVEDAWGWRKDGVVETVACRTMLVSFFLGRRERLGWDTLNCKCFFSLFLISRVVNCLDSFVSLRFLFRWFWSCIRALILESKILDLIFVGEIRNNLLKLSRN